MRFAKLLPFFSSLLILSACTNESESDLIDEASNDEIITYTGTVKSVMSDNCITCHGTTPSNGTNFSLTNYENVKNAVLNRGLLDRISRAQGSPGMMPNGGTRLSQATIDQIIKWKNDGLPE